MKIKISYSDIETEKAEKIELLLREVFSSGEKVKIRKPKQQSDFHHTYLSVENLKA